MDAVCSHRPHPAGRGLDREKLYWELSQLTHEVSRLGPYILDRDHLYVNGECLMATGVPLLATPGTFCC